MPDNSAIFSPVTTRRASEAIYEQIRDRILSGELVPGSRLPSERELIALFQRSRPTVREALRMLEQDGLVESRPGSVGAVVTTPSAKNTEQTLSHLICLNMVSPAELMEYRLANEVTNAGWAAERRTDDELLSIERCVLSLENAEDIPSMIIQYDSAFHSCVGKASHNRLVSLLGDTINQLTMDYLAKYFQRHSFESTQTDYRKITSELRHIYNAIKYQDAETAKKLMHEHLAHVEMGE